MIGFRDFTDFLAAVFWTQETDPEEAALLMLAVQTGDVDAGRGLSYRFYGRLTEDERRAWRGVATAEIDGAGTGLSTRLAKLAPEEAAV